MCPYLLSTPGLIPCGNGAEEDAVGVADGEEDTPPVAPAPPLAEWSEDENGLPNGESSSGCNWAAI